MDTQRCGFCCPKGRVETVTVIQGKWKLSKSFLLGTQDAFFTWHPSASLYPSPSSHAPSLARGPGAEARPLCRTSKEGVKI